MIQQQYFAPPPYVYTPIKHLPIVLPPATAASATRLHEKIALQTGDSLDLKDLSEAARQNIFMFANTMSTRMNLHTPKWVHKRTAPFEKLSFQDLYLTQGMKEHAKECHFARDAAGAIICFNVKAFKVGDYLNAWNSQTAQSFSILDSFSIAVIPQDLVKRTFGSAPQYQEFMTLKGYEAC